MFGHPLNPRRPAPGTLVLLMLTAIPLQAMDLKLDDGRVLKGAEVGSVSGVSIAINHDEGVSNVQPEDLSDEGRHLLRKEIRTYWRRHHKFVLRKAESLPPAKRVEYLSDEIDKHPDAPDIQELRTLRDVAHSLTQAERTANVYQTCMILEKVLADYPDAPNAAELRTRLNALQNQTDELAVGKAVYEAEQESDPDTALAMLQEAMTAHPRAANLELAKRTKSKLESAALRKLLRQFGNAADGTLDEARRRHDELTAALRKYAHADPAARKDAQRIAAQLQSRIGALDSAGDRLAETLTRARQMPNIYQAAKVLEKALADHPDAPNQAEIKAQLAAWQARTEDFAVGRAVWEMEKEPDFATGIAVLKEIKATYPGATNLALADQTIVRLESSIALRKAIQAAEQNPAPDAALAALQKAMAEFPDAVNLAAAKQTIDTLQSKGLHLAVQQILAQPDKSAAAVYRQHKALQLISEKYPRADQASQQEAKLVLAQLLDRAKKLQAQEARAEITAALRREIRAVRDVGMAQTVDEAERQYENVQKIIAKYPAADLSVRQDALRFLDQLKKHLYAFDGENRERATISFSNSNGMEKLYFMLPYSKDWAAKCNRMYNAFKDSHNLEYWKELSEWEFDARQRYESCLSDMQFALRMIRSLVEGDGCLSGGVSSADNFRFVNVDPGHYICIICCLDTNEFWWTDSVKKPGRPLAYNLR